MPTDGDTRATDFLDPPLIRLLVVDDDEDDYLLVRELLSDARMTRYDVHWSPEFQQGLEKCSAGTFDVCLVDYALGYHNGLNFLERAKEIMPKVPIILLTGKGDYHLDMQALEVGAEDYLDKNNLRSDLLDRAVRHAIERNKAKVYLTELSSRILEAQEIERKYIAAELHDGISSKLSSIKYHIEAQASIRKGRPVPGDPSLDRTISMLQDAIQDVRRIMLRLRPSILDDLGIVVTLNWACNEFNRTYSHIRVEQDIQDVEEHVPERLKIVIYRVVQEALNNVAKHSGADLVRVGLIMEKSRLILSIEDNGRGLSEKAPPHAVLPQSGMGLANMEYRVNISGGAFLLTEPPGGGTMIRCSWRL